MASDRIDGAWYPPGASQRNEASLRLDENTELVVETGAGEVARAPAAKVEVSARVAAVPRRLSFPDGSMFETSDNDGVDRLTGAHENASGLIAGLEQFRPRLFVFAAIAIALCYAIYRFAVPALVEVAVAVTPPAFPQVIGRSALASLDQALLSPSELAADKQSKIRSEFDLLAAHSPRGAQAYSLNFRKGGSIGPNAFALPDGSLVVTDELVELAANDEAVLGVLGHEIAHVEGEHTLRQLYRAAGVAGLIMLIGGDIGSAGEDILTQGSALVAMSYSRKQESQADRRSVELMLAAGRDPTAIVGFFDKLNKLQGDMGVPAMLSTHPDTEGRMDAVKAYAEELQAKGG